MPTSTSRLAYEDCYEILDMAIEDEAGARVEVSSRGDAVSLRTRLHTARRINRQENMMIYEKDHPLYGKSVYDKLVVRIKEVGEAVYLYIERIKLKSRIEPLSGVEQLEAPRPMKLISPPQNVQIQRIAWRRA